MSVRDTELDDLDLVERFKRTGDEEWFSLLYERHELAIYVICKHLIGDGSRAEDFTQATFAKAWQGIHRFRETSNGVNFAGWLATIARNACLSWLRRKDRVVQPDPPYTPISSSPDPIPLFHEVEKILEALDKGPRLCWVMFHSEGFTYKEISERTGYSVAEVKNYIRIAREALRKKLR